jgi:hypothetical protein
LGGGDVLAIERLGFFGLPKVRPRRQKLALLLLDVALERFCLLLLRMGGKPVALPDGLVAETLLPACLNRVRVPERVVRLWRDDRLNGLQGERKYLLELLLLLREARTSGTWRLSS